MQTTSLLTIANDWELWRTALAGSGTHTEAQFRTMRLPDRLRALVEVVGKERIAEEINEHLDQLRVSHKYLGEGFDCAIQPNWRGLTLGFCKNGYEDFDFISIDACRVLPALERLHLAVEANPEMDRFEVWRKVRAIGRRYS